MFKLFLVIILTAVTALASMSGGLLLLTGSKLAKFFEKYGASFAAGILLYAVFGDIIPEILEENALPVYQVAWLIIVAAAACFIASFFAGFFHKHGEHKKIKNKTQAYAMFIVDSIHSILDGVILGVSFAASLPTGIITAVATAAHEIPQEIGDFSIMLRSKIKKSKIVKLQTISAAMMLLATIISYFIGDILSPALPTMLCLVAGGLLYIAIREIIEIITPVIRRAKKGIVSGK